MARVLVVEPHQTLAAVLRLLLEQAGYSVESAAHGGVAMSIIQRSPPDAVITDPQIPIVDGLQLVEAVRKNYPAVPVILTTTVGTGDATVQALRKGATSFVPKAHLETELVPTLRDVLAITSAQRHKQQLVDQMVCVAAVFELSTDLGLVTPLVAHVDDMLKRMDFRDDALRVRLGIALHEAIINAIVHGNLEIDSDIRDGEAAAYSLILQQRMTSDPYQSRKVYVEIHVGRDEARFVVRDEGRGFLPESLPDPTAPGNIDRACGRGLFLIRTFLDEVRHNGRGNEITMIKRRWAECP